MPKKAAPTWKEYQEKAINDRIPRSQPLLYPIMIGMDMVKIGKSPVKSPVITRSRLKTTTLGVEGKTSRNYLMPKVARAVTERQADLFGPVYKHYYDFYHPYDGQQSPVKPSPLDMYGLKHPVVFMFWLKHKNWAFSGQKQFDVENDVRGNPTVQNMTTFGNPIGLPDDGYHHRPRDE